MFLFSKRERYYYDAAAIAEESIRAGETVITSPKGFAGQASARGVKPSGNAILGTIQSVGPTRNARTVWTITTVPYAEAHFATFPPELPRRCILAGSKPGDTVIDPFLGAGTTGLVAHQLGRSFVGIELNPKYLKLAGKRIFGAAPLLFAEPSSTPEPAAVQAALWPEGGI